MTFKQKLESQEAEEGASVTLRCEISKPGVSVEWKKGVQVLKAGEKYQMKQTASVNELQIAKVVPEDSGDYSCICGDQKTTASLKIKGRRICDVNLYVEKYLSTLEKSTCCALFVTACKLYNASLFAHVFSLCFLCFRRNICIIL